MKTIKVRYFAILREQRGLSNETLQTAAPDAQSLYLDLAKAHHFTLPVDRLRAAINGDFIAWPAPLTEGDDVVFIPPVAGG